MKYVRVTGILIRYPKDMHQKQKEHTVSKRVDSSNMAQVTMKDVLFISAGHTYLF